MPPKLRLSFDLPEHGWLGITFSHGDLVYSDSFSHIYPSLQGLCDAACDVVNGYPARPVFFFLEPAELELRFEQRGSQIALALTLFRNRLRPPTALGTPVFEALVEPPTAVLACWRALRQLQSSLPAEEFEARWREPFPEGSMLSLTTAVSRLRNST